jgi:integral membrane protein
MGDLTARRYDYQVPRHPYPAAPVAGMPPEIQTVGAPSLRGFFQRGTVGSLIRYRVMAFVVGTMLMLLFVIVLCQAAGLGLKIEEKIVAPLHGYLYLAYLVTAADLARRTGWRLGRVVLVVLAGFVPTMAFFVEHYIYRQIQTDWTADPTAYRAAIDGRPSAKDRRSRSDDTGP